MARDEHVLVEVSDGARQADNDAGKDDQRHAIADAAVTDLLAEPHDEGRARGEGEDCHEPKSPALLAQVAALQHERDRGALDDTEPNRQVARPLRDLAPPQLALFLKLFERRDDDGQQLQDDRRRDVGHDAQREDRELAELPPGEKIHEAKGCTLRLLEQPLQLFGVNTGSWNVPSDAING